MVTITPTDDQITRALNRIAASLTNMTPLIGSHLIDTTEDRLKTGTARDGRA